MAKSKKGLIELKQAEIEIVQEQLQEQTKLMNDLWNEHNRFRMTGDTLKAIEAKGKYEHIENTVIPQLEQKHSQLEYELGGVSAEGYKTGLLGELKGLEARRPRLEKQVADKKAEIQKAKQRFEELMQQLETEIADTEAEMEHVTERVKELIGG